MHGDRRQPDGKAMTAEGETGSTVPRRQLGRYLRELREKSGMTVRAAANTLECSFQKVWRIERGAVPVRGPDVKVLCQVYNVILSESVLRAAPATPGAMAQQLWHLLKANELPHVCVRVLPSVVGPHWASRSGAFTILEFPNSEERSSEPPTIYSESLTGALYLDKPKEIGAYERAWSILGGLALDVEQSGQMIQKIMREMNHGA